MKQGHLIFFLLLAALAMTACQVGIERNLDGSLRLEATMTEDQLESELRSALADPAIEQIAVEAHDGYLAVAAERGRSNGAQTDRLTFRLDLDAVDGHLSAQVSDVVFDGFSASQARVEEWNERIAANLERAGARRPNSSLQSVQVTTQGVTMIWRIETARSRSR